MFAVKMLGGLTVTLDDRRVHINLGASGRLLAAYLFEFAGHVHRRERLAELFWQDLDAEHSKAALNTALWRLRKLLALDAASNGGANLYSSGSEIVLERATWLAVDTHRFDCAARTALSTPGAIDVSPKAKAIEAVADTYSGAFLDGDHSGWIIAERERLHALYVRCLSELMRTYVNSEDYEWAITAVRRILMVDPFRESAQRALAVLLTLNGQRVQAIGELRRWRKALRTEIGIDPTPETTALEQAIVSGDVFKHLPTIKHSCFSRSTAA